MLKRLINILDYLIKYFGLMKRNMLLYIDEKVVGVIPAEYLSVFVGYKNL